MNRGLMSQQITRWINRGEFVRGQKKPHNIYRQLKRKKMTGIETMKYLLKRHKYKCNNIEEIFIDDIWIGILLIIRCEYIEGGISS